MIKKYNDFNKTDYSHKERESMERELQFRKTKRDNIKYSTNITLDSIKSQILSIINMTDDYILTIGNRIENLENSSEKVFHIEFENDSLGRIRIFKPKDITTKGYYEVNGNYYETDVKELRDFYHTLNQLLLKNN